MGEVLREVHGSVLGVDVTQKIIRVREDQPIPAYHLDELTRSWNVERVLGRTEDGWLCVLLELDEKESAEKLLRHEEYLGVVSRLRIPPR